MRKSVIVAAAAAASLLAGGAAGALLFTPVQAGAQTTPPTTAKPSAPGVPGTPRTRGPNGPGRGGKAEAVSDLSVAANAIGIPETDVTTAMKAGQSLAAIAKAHTVDPQKVIDALVADAKSELAAGVTSGKLTQAQADQATPNLTQRITDQVNGVRGPGRAGPGGPFAGRAPGFGPLGPGKGGGRLEAVSDVSVAAKAIGIPETDVTTAMKAGQSLAAIAKAHTVDPQKVIDALVADAKSELAAGVTSGKLTQAQADQATTNLTQQITDQVNGVGGHKGR